MKSLQDLPVPWLYISEGDTMYASHFIIPQLEGTEMPIITHDVTTASKMLGDHFSPAGNSPMHVKHMVQKGLDWVDCLCTKPVSQGDAWLSSFLQLFPGILWGLVTVCMPPKQPDGCIQCFYAKALPFLGVNCKIKKEWRTLPDMYQGLALPNLPLVALADKISFLLGNWDFYGQAHSNSLVMAYDNFLIEVGLYGSPLQWSYKDFGHLSTESTWFQNLWQLVQLFKVDLSFRDEDLMHRVQENDRALMSEFFCLGYRGRDLAALNIVRLFCNLLHLSDISKCDDSILDKFGISDSAESLVLHAFLQEQPSPFDFHLWKEAIGCLCSGTTILLSTLGRHIHLPHLPVLWFTTTYCAHLYHVCENIYDIYKKRRGLGTRHKTKYDRISTEGGPHPGTHFASVTIMCSDICAVMHLCMPLQTPSMVDQRFK